jgi:hypothetical protein
MNRRTLGIVVAGVLVAVLAPHLGTRHVAAEEKLGGIPAGYRNWTHVKSEAIVDKAHPLFEPFAGIHHVYINQKGAAAVRTGGPYPDGSLFVYDLLEAIPQGGAYVEGNRRVLATMLKNKKKYAATGGWRFEAYVAGDPSNPAVNDAAKECFSCHTSQAKTDYVFSAWRK